MFAVITTLHVHVRSAVAPTRHVTVTVVVDHRHAENVEEIHVILTQAVMIHALTNDLMNSGPHLYSSTGELAYMNTCLFKSTFNAQIYI